MSASQLIVLTGEAAAARQQQMVWIGLAIGGACFVAVALLAIRRNLTQDRRPVSRPGRIVETAALWSVPYTAMCVPGMGGLYAGSAFGSAALVDVLRSTAFFMIPALLLIGAADLLLDALTLRRTPAWLLIGPLLLGGFAIGLLAGSHWMDIFRAEPGWREVMLAGALLIAGIGWWSRLPGRDAAAGEIFD
jgi:hypothetical protein